ncbi:TlpA family protein disulfide reductase [Maribacter sp.]|nr:TlpA family protein disulfide reductase [Maribacter sp.]
MKNLAVTFVLLLLLNGCKNADPVEPAMGVWRAELSVMDNQLLPFNFKLLKSDSGKYMMEVYNAEEVINVDEIRVFNDSIVIKMPVYEGYMAGTFTKNEMKGKFIKESLDRIVPFTATFDAHSRFDTAAVASGDVSGIWETRFNTNQEDEYIAKGIFKQKGNKVTGTFETTTGDYRYLDGVIDGDSLKVSAFDGAHAFLFTAKLKDSTLNGAFYSGNHSKETMNAKRNESYILPSADSLTFLKEGYEQLAFKFPDSEGNFISLSDEQFQNKVVLIQIMGSWCPNCLDETKYYTQYLQDNPSSKLEIIALAFEYAKTQEKAFNSIKRLTDRIGVKYPVLLAQYGTSDKEEAQEKLPMLNHVLSYPTTIFVDKKGNVRKIHTGFNGPATGEKYELFKTAFDKFVKQLLDE